MQALELLALAAAAAAIRTARADDARPLEYRLTRRHEFGVVEFGTAETIARAQHGIDELAAATADVLRSALPDGVAPAQLEAVEVERETGRYVEEDASAHRDEGGRITRTAVLRAERAKIDLRTQIEVPRGSYLRLAGHLDVAPGTITRWRNHAKSIHRRSWVRLLALVESSPNAPLLDGSRAYIQRRLAACTFDPERDDAARSREIARKNGSVIAATIRALYPHVLAPLDEIQDAAARSRATDRVVAELHRTPVGLPLMNGGAPDDSLIPLLLDVLTEAVADELRREVRIDQLTARASALGAVRTPAAKPRTSPKPSARKPRTRKQTARNT